MKESQYLLAATAFIATWSHVLAGSRAWQPSIAQIRGEPELSPGEVLGYGNVSNAIRDLPGHGITKRYLSIDPTAGDAKTSIWPGGKVIYCWESEEFQKDLEALFKTALQLWFEAGLPSEHFGFTEASSDVCNDKTKWNGQRNKILVIKKGTALGTTPGLPPLSAQSGFGPEMTLTPSDQVANFGHLDAKANIAHEIGHAWGLKHEHQNQYFWDSAYAPYARGGKVYFGANNFHCERLADYARVRDKRMADNPAISQDAADRWMKGENGPCSKIDVAGDYGFTGGMNFLPETVDSVSFSSKRDIDWKSIMIYPTGSGGTNRAAVLTRPDGSDIAPVLYPSKSDIVGLVKLYKYSGKWKYRPYGDKGSAVQNAFKKILRKDKDSGC